MFTLNVNTDKKVQTMYISVKMKGLFINTPKVY